MTSPPVTAGQRTCRASLVKLNCELGASAGGLAAFTELLASLPADSGMAFVVVQHLDPTHPSMLAEALARVAPMKVDTAAEGMKVEPNHVYVIPPNADLALRDDSLVLLPLEPARKPHLAIDFFFRSLAAERGAQAFVGKPFDLRALIEQTKQIVPA